MSQRRRWVTTIAVALLVTGCSGTAPATRPASGHAPTRVVLFGDSLAYQAAPYFDQLVQAHGSVNVTDFVFGGTAACDWLPDMRRVARLRPQAVVMEFSGNAFTSCMGGCPPESSSAISKYCVDVSAAIHLFVAVGTRVFLAGTPISYGQSVAHDRHWNDLNRAFASLAKEYPRNVTYVDAGAPWRDLEGPSPGHCRALPPSRALDRRWPACERTWCAQLTVAISVSSTTTTIQVAAATARERSASPLPWRLRSSRPST